MNVEPESLTSDYIILDITEHNTIASDTEIKPDSERVIVPLTARGLIQTVWL